MHVGEQRGGGHAGPRREGVRPASMWRKEESRWGSLEVRGWVEPSGQGPWGPEDSSQSSLGGAKAHLQLSWGIFKGSRSLHMGGLLTGRF